MTDTAWWRTQDVAVMGTTGTVIVGGGTSDDLTWAAHELARLHRCWTRFDQASELCRLNAAGGPAVVSPTLFDAITKAIALWELTDGWFDPAVLADLERAGYDRSFEAVALDAPAPAPAPHRDRSAPRVRPSTGSIELNQRLRLVELPPGLRVDLGGIGKGLAADRVAEALVARGASSALVELGGDLRVAGTPPGDGWPVPVVDPATGTELFDHRLTTGGLAASTTTLRRWRRSGVEQHHLIDPRMGAPARTGVATVIATATATWLAEGVAKAALVAGLEEGQRLLRRLHLLGWIVTDAGLVHAPVTLEPVG